MKSAYPSSQSFFDDTSDSISVDIEKCRGSASFSSLTDLFTNRSSKSDLFPHARASDFVQEVRFPAKKKRECEERTSIWHEWGSGECQSEHVAQESYGFSTEHLSDNSSAPSSSNFPNLGSANISLVAEGFQYPARKTREEGSSWREERASWQDWSTPSAPRESKVSESSPIVGSITDMYLSQSCAKRLDLFASSKSSPFSSLGAPSRSASEEVSFPARKKREERTFWQESSSDATPSDCEVIITPRDSAPGSVTSLADMYLRKAGVKCSNLFSSRSVDSSEEVVFPKRKDRSDRNAWRDWTNSGYGEHEDETEHDVDNSSRSRTGVVTAEVDELARVQKDSISGTGSPSIDGSVRTAEELSTMANLPDSECETRSSAVHGAEGEVEDSLQVRGQPSEVQACDGLLGMDIRKPSNVDPLEPFREPSASIPERSVDEAESCDTMGESIEEVTVPEFRFPLCRSEKSNSRNVFKYPPPLRSSQGGVQSRVPSHMPWVQLQHIRRDGRFVLQEVKVTQPVVFQPTRKEGRLVLELIGQENKKASSVPRFYSSSPVADEKPTPVSVVVGSQDSVTMKTGHEMAVPAKAEAIKADDVCVQMKVEADDVVVQEEVEVINSIAVKADEKVEEPEEVEVRQLVPERVGAEHSLTMKMDDKVVAEKAEARPSHDHAALVPAERKKRASKVWPFFGSVTEKEKVSKEKKSAKVWPVFFPIPREIVPGEEVMFARAEEGAAGMWDMKFNFRDMCYMGEEIVASSDRGEELVSGGDVALVPDRSPPWLLSKVLPEDRRFDTRRALQSATMRNATERLGQSGNIIAAHSRVRARDAAALRLHFQALPRSSSLRNGLPGINSSRNDGEGSLTRSRGIRSSAVFDALNGETGKEEGQIRGRAVDVRIPVSQGLIRDGVVRTSYQFFGRRSMRTRTDLPGESEQKLASIRPPMASLSCAEVMGKQHLEKNFWEQQPCVS